MSSMPPPPPMPSASAGPKEEAAGLFAALFDFSFTKYATPQIVKIVYALGIFGVGLYTLFFVVMGFNSGQPVLGVFALILAPILGLFLLMFLRLTMELYAATVRMSEDIHKRLPPAS